MFTNFSLSLLPHVPCILRVGVGPIIYSEGSFSVLTNSNHAKHEHKTIINSIATVKMFVTGCVMVEDHLMTKVKHR